MARAHTGFVIPERFLRQVWKHLHFETTHLQSLDGKPIEILSSGTPNADAGPDFRNARIRIDGILYRGDVELHQSEEEWQQHSHHRDPRYNSVILHVVLRRDSRSTSPRTKSERAVPVLVLEPYVSSPYRELWEKMILDERAERLATIKCHVRNDIVPSSMISDWLKKLAIQRMELKIRRFEERLKELVEETQLAVQEPPQTYDDVPFGLNPEELPIPIPQISSGDFRRIDQWQQLLYEGIMEALGYSKNQSPFLALARNVPLSKLSALRDTARRKHGEVSDVLIYESILFAAAGLMPAIRDLSDPQGRTYLTRLRDVWRAVEGDFRNQFLSAADWQFFRLRPENFPTRRIAGAARLVPKLTSKEFFKSLIQAVKADECSGEVKSKRLAAALIVEADGFWAHHYRFEETTDAKMARVIGASRALEMVLNVLVPICLLYARTFKEKNVRRGATEIFEATRAPLTNTITRTMQHQLMKDRGVIDSAMLQQGALQLYKFWCMEERCAECAVGKIAFARS